MKDVDFTFDWTGKGVGDSLAGRFILGVVAVPEPGTFAVLVIACAAPAVCRKWRTRKAKSVLI